MKTESLYESRQCPRCDRDFLFPAYGNRICNDCAMAMVCRHCRGSGLLPKSGRRVCSDCVQKRKAAWEWRKRWRVELKGDPR